MQTVILMYSREYFSPFVKLTCDILNVDSIIWIDDHTKDYDLDGTKYKCFHISQIHQLIEQGTSECVRIISFDIHLIPVIACLRLIKESFERSDKSYEFCFIQHGTFSDLSVAKRSGYKIKWLLRSVNALTTFIKTIPLVKIPRAIWVCLYSFYLGSYQCRNELAEFIPRFRYGVFWNKADIALLGGKIISKFENILETRPPDDERVSIQFCSKAAPVYISQPLYEDDLVGRDEFVDFVSRIRDKFPSLKVVLHPRSDRDIFSEFSQDELIVLDKTANNLTTSLVIGHFSSLLLVVPKNVPLQTVDLNNAVVRKSIERFYSAYNNLDNDVNRIAFSELSSLLSDN